MPDGSTTITDNFANNGSLLFYQDTSDRIVSGVISGIGTLTKTGAGTLMLIAANTYTGTTTISGGTLKLTNSLASSDIVDNAALTFDTSIGDITYNGAISGTGTLTKAGAGTLTLTSASTYTGATIISAGTLAVNGSIAGNSGVNVNAGARLQGNGTVARVINNSGGTVAPGNSIGTLNVSGDYVQDAGATLEVEINAAGQCDKLIVGGTAVLNGTLSVLAESGTYYAGTNYTFLTAANGIVGTFSGIPNNGTVGIFSDLTTNIAFLTPSLIYDAHSVSLMLTRNATHFADVAVTANQRAVATTLDGVPTTVTGDISTVIDSISMLSAGGARGAFDRTGGLVHTAVGGAAAMSFNRYLDTVAGRMGGFSASSAEENPQRGFWVKGYRSLGARTGGDIASRYDYRTGGVAVGYDHQVSDRLLVGVATGYADTKTTMKEISEYGKATGGQYSLYGSWLNGPWYVNGVIAYEDNHYTSTRNITFGGISRTARAAYDGHGFSGYTEAGYRIKRANNVTVIPMVTLATNRLDRNGFTETDAGALNLVAKKSHTSSLSGSLGVKIRQEQESAACFFAKEFKARWVHDFKSRDDSLTAAFSGVPDTTFTVAGEKLPRDSVNLGVSLTWKTKKNVSWLLAYDANLDKGWNEQCLAVSMRRTW